MDIGRTISRKGLRIHLIPKNAHSAIHTAFEKPSLRAVISDCTEDSEDRRMIVVRHPCDRLISAWTFFCYKRLDLPFNEGMGVLGYKARMTLDEFYDLYKLKYNDNIHTQLQVSFTGGHKIDEVVKMEDLNDWWVKNTLKYELPTMTKTNSSEHEHWETYFSPEMRKEIEVLFKEDLELYNSNHWRAE